VWEKSIQGHVLGAFFYGYTISQIPGGLLAERFGAKWVLFSFLGLSSLATLLTPLAARFNVFLLIGLRVIVGVGSVGGVYSDIFTPPLVIFLLGGKDPPVERRYPSPLTKGFFSVFKCYLMSITSPPQTFVHTPPISNS